ncbi:MAG: hypothetical protein DRJ42_07230 [Deltaproteobacteria bacterium]|nr:MAG: hypothetical protein DRJ42_07230 [Deltaproteobacteria bacterium]
MVLLGCGDDGTSSDAAIDTSTPDSSTPDTSVPDAGAVRSFTVVAQALPDNTPVADVIIVVDVAGERFTETTGADGMASFTDVPEGPTDMSAWKASYGVFATLGVTLATDAPNVALMVPRDLDFVGITGNATDIPINELLHVSAAHPFASPVNGAGGVFRINVPADQTLDVTAFHYDDGPPPNRGISRTIMRTAQNSVTVADMDVTIDLDFASPLTLVTATGSVLLPPGVRGSTGDVDVTVQGESALSVGLATRAEVSADGTRLEYDVSYEDRAGIVTRFTLEGAITEFVTEGVPTGASDLGFADPPEVALPGAGHSIYDPVAFVSGDPTQPLLYLGVFERVRAFNISVQPGQSVARVPAAPDGFDTTPLFGDAAAGDTVDAFLATCTDFGDISDGVCTAVSAGPNFELTP